MSKSNIKNINNICIKKEPYINFSKSTYKSLLFKLKKSTIWLSSNRGVVNLLFLTNKYDHYFKYFTSFNLRIKPKRKKKIIIYNPNTVNNLNNVEEMSYIKRIKVSI